MNIPTVQGFVIGYYFRSRKGGAVIAKGCSTHDQYPWLLEQVIIQVRERGFKPIRILCDNEGSFIPLPVKTNRVFSEIGFSPLCSQRPDHKNSKILGFFEKFKKNILKKIPIFRFGRKKKLEKKWTFCLFFFVFFGFFFFPIWDFEIWVEKNILQKKSS